MPFMIKWILAPIMNILNFYFEQVNLESLPNWEEKQLFKE